VTYTRRASPLHAARAAVGSAWCAALAAFALCVQHPLLLAAVLVSALLGAAAAGVLRPVAGVLKWTLPLALAWALVNPLVSHQGLTVLVEGWTVPVLGRLDITLEATTYGLVLALRIVALVACFALHSAAVDPDALLRAFRRIGFRSALTAAIATRMVGVLAGDARRLHDAQRCRGTQAASKWLIVRAVTGGVLDRSLDVAATLEVRGYGGARRAVRERRPWSRHDLAFAASALALAALSIGALAAGWDGFSPYPRTVMPFDAGTWGLALALIACALAPFAQRRGTG
jgi:energy-coupling factor transport system permease protein